MDVRLTGQTPVVTGGSKGIGLAVTRALADSGAHVIAGAKKSSAELDDLARTGHVQAVEVDLAAADGPARLVAAGGRVNILVNNVGATPVRTGGFLSITDDDWLATINLDLMAAVRACRAVLPAMLDAGSGAIVTICSVNARLPEPGVDYSVAKAGLASFCKAAVQEVGPRGIRVNTVSPGPVATDLWLGASGVAQTVSAASGNKPEEVASRQPDGHRPLHAAQRSRRRRALPGQQPGQQHYRRRLHHRRRLCPHLVSPRHVPPHRDAA
jgi:NAD(P)-dependent dehydrogenase (short-subunit alcohol dehydrogenase family)